MGVFAATAMVAGLIGVSAPAAQSTHAEGPSEESEAPSPGYPAPGQPIPPGPGSDSSTSTVEQAEGDIRIATLHANITANADGSEGNPVENLVASLKSQNHDVARTVAQTAQINAPDILVLTGVTYDQEEQIAEALQDYLARGQHGQHGLDYPYFFTAPTNSGVDSGADLDGDGTIGGPNDAIGYGEYTGHYGMVVFSKYPIVEDQTRTFQNFLWSDLPDSNMPEDRYSEVEESTLRLAQTTLWDIAVEPEGWDAPLHLVTGSSVAGDNSSEADVLRAADTARVMADYVAGDAWYIYDDDGQEGGLGFGNDAVIVGNPLLTAGDAADELTEHYAIQDPEPEAITEIPVEERPGDVEQTSAVATRYIDGGEDLRLSYVLPNAVLEVGNAGVFWPGQGEYGYQVVNPQLSRSLDNRLVWVDLSD